MPLYHKDREVEYKWARYGGIESDASLDIATIAMEAEWNGERFIGDNSSLSEDEINRLKSTYYNKLLRVFTGDFFTDIHIDKNMRPDEVDIYLTFKITYTGYDIYNTVMRNEKYLISIMDLFKLLHKFIHNSGVLENESPDIIESDFIIDTQRFTVKTKTTNENARKSAILELNGTMRINLTEIEFMYERNKSSQLLKTNLEASPLLSDLLNNEFNYNIENHFSNFISTTLNRVTYDRNYSDLKYPQSAKLANDIYYDLFELIYSYDDERLALKNKLYEDDILKFRDYIHGEYANKRNVFFYILNNKFRYFRLNNISNENILNDILSRGGSIFYTLANPYRSDGTLIENTTNFPLINDNNSSNLKLIPFVLDKPNEVKLTDFGFVLPSDSYIVDWDDGPITTDWTEYLSRANHIYNPTSSLGFHLIEAKGHDFSHSFKKLKLTDTDYMKFFLSEKKFSRPGVTPEMIMRTFGYVFNKTKPEIISMFSHINVTKFIYKGYITYLLELNYSNLIPKYVAKLEAIPEDENLRIKCNELIRELRTETNQF